MVRTRTKLVACGLLAVVLVVWVVRGCPYPTIDVQVEHRLSGPDHESIHLLLQGATLEDIQTSVTRSGIPVDSIAWNGRSLLYYAAREQRLDIVEWLLEAGANPDGIDSGLTPLSAAINRGNLPLVKLLISAGANPDLRSPLGITPRMLAKTEGNPAIIEALSGNSAIPPP